MDAHRPSDPDRSADADRAADAGGSVPSPGADAPGASAVTDAGSDVALVRRLGALGEAPVDETVAAAHLAAMAAVPVDGTVPAAHLAATAAVPVDGTVPAAHLAATAAVPAGVSPSGGAGEATGGGDRGRFGWRAVAAAAFVGFLAGSTGLAAAGTLPDPAQDVAHHVLARVGIDVPRSTEGCPEGQTFRNHGEYVSSVEAAGGDVEAASHSDCGMPMGRGGGAGNGVGNGGGGNGGGGNGTPRPDTDGDPCTGPPPWAGAHLTREARAALQEQRRATCGDDLEDDADEETESPEAEAGEDVEEPEGDDGASGTEAPAEPTSTTGAPTTTIEAPSTTTAGG